MFRKFTASAFLLVMGLLIALKHPTLGYCLCVDSYFAGSCDCRTELPLKTASSDDAACSGCCPSSAYGSKTAGFAAQDPCTDCEDVLMIDVGDFLWHGSTEVHEAGDSIATTPAFAQAAYQLPKALLKSAISARGDPPPTLGAGIPLYLRHSVLRL